MPTEVVIFCDEVDTSSTQSLADTQTAFEVSVIPLKNGPELAKVIRTAVCSRRAKPGTSVSSFCCVNWCSGDVESTDRADASKVAELLETVFKVPLVGNPLAITRYDIEDIRMLMFYSDLPCNNFCIVKQASDMAQLNGIKCPAHVLIGKSTSTAANAEMLPNTVLNGLLTYPLVLVTEADVVASHTMTLLVQGGAIYNTPLTLTPIAGSAASNVGEATEKAVSDFASTVASTIMGKQGFAKVLVHVDEKGTLTLVDVAFNVSTPIADAGVTMEAYLKAEVDYSTKAFVAALPRHVVSFDTVGKGYFMRAARAIAEGEVVFEDERRAFAIVTREHVAKTWSDADKYTFSRYAWPLDSDCHVYAIWEDDPKRWRPINHSCDPNLFFAEGHSLNVIARRPIAEGEDLTLDYSTFCDYTMKPFECFCKSAICRGTVTPGQVPWKQYGTHSWFRREPPQVTDLAPKIA